MPERETWYEQLLREAWEWQARVAREVSAEFDRQVAALTAYFAGGKPAQPASQEAISSPSAAGDDEEDGYELLGLTSRDQHALKQLRELRDWAYLTPEEYALKEAQILKLQPHRPEAEPPQPAPSRAPVRVAPSVTAPSIVASQRSPKPSPAPSPKSSARRSNSFKATPVASSKANTLAEHLRPAAVPTPPAPAVNTPAPTPGPPAPLPSHNLRSPSPAPSRPARAASPSPSNRAHGRRASANAALQGAPNPYDGGPRDKSTRQMFDKRQLRRDKARSYIPAIAEWRARFLDDMAANFTLDANKEGRRQWLRAYIRKRPLFEREEANGEYDVVSIASPREDGSVVQQVTVHNCLTEADLYRMYMRNISIAGHAVFGEGSTSEDLYEAMARPLVSRAVDGHISTIFSFGQTGSGKTFTCNAIESMAAQQVFEEVKFAANQGVELVVSLVFVEIFGNHVSDLLSKGCELLVLKEDAKGVTQLVGASKPEAASAHELLELIEAGKARRKTEMTAQNATSSRSHAMMQILIEEPAQAQDERGSAESNGHDEEDAKRAKRQSRSQRPWNIKPGKRAEAAEGRVGKLVLVDLAGTERKEDSMWHTAERRKEGAQINASLYALKECMRMMASEDDAPSPAKGAKAGGKVPYKSHALTRVLADSFTHENAMTAVLATVSPGSTDTEHTLHTLHTVAGMCGIDHLTTEHRTEVAEVIPQDEAALASNAPQVHPPNKWSHDRVKEWMASVKGGQFKPQADMLPKHVDGATIVKEPIFWYKQVLCNGDEKRANRIYAALREEVSKANKLKYEHVLKVGKAREQSKYTS